MEKRVELNWLLDFYGPLLTENRLKIVRLYCEEDMTLQEIAEQSGISRQGVYDALSNAQAQLMKYEEKLGLLLHYRSLQAEIDRCRDALSRVTPAKGSEEALHQAAHSLNQMEWIQR